MVGSLMVRGSFKILGSLSTRGSFAWQETFGAIGSLTNPDSLLDTGSLRTHWFIPSL